ncbi:MAG: right-handed parallel beta-helix repeat-containing protein [Planctomycetota bacterium]
MRARTSLEVGTMLLLASTAFGAVIKVPGDQPSITAAVAAATSGDTIKIAAGRWQEAVTTITSLTFKGEAGTIWDGYFSSSDHDQLTVTADSVKVQGIEFQNGFSCLIITGDDAKVTGCRFRGCAEAVYVDGARANVSNNTFTGMVNPNGFAVEIDGADCVANENVIKNSWGFGIDLDAESLGSATCDENNVHNNQEFGQISVRNAAAPSVQRNVFSNCYSSAECINVSNCDDAKVIGNTVLNVNYNVAYGIYVEGANAVVSRNVVENLNHYNGEIYGIGVIGDDCDVLKNMVYGINSGESFWSWGIHVSGNDANVQKNQVYDCGGGGGYSYGIYIDGADLVCRKNRVVRMNNEYTYGLYLDGADADVGGNRVMYVMESAAIHVTGADFHVYGNYCSHMAYDCYGIETSGSGTGPGLAIMEDNTVVNGVYLGIDHSGDGVILRRNDCTLIGDAAFNISGTNNTIDRCAARDVAGDGFYVSGAGNTLSRCKATDCDKDGFDIGAGAGNSLNLCKATNCAAEGLDNGGTGTTATNCTLKRSRIDFAGGGGMTSWAGTTYTTGGEGVSGEID